MKPRKLVLLISLTLACALSVAEARAQQNGATVFASGLKAPTKLVLTPRGNLLVAESGDAPNAGRLSLINRQTGARRTILDGLPAGPGIDGGTSGPSALALRGDTLFLVIGAGDGVLAGPAPGTEKANPNPSSPIISSVLSIKASPGVETATAAFPALTPADHQALKGGSQVTLSNGQGDTLTISLVVDFPNFVAEPRPDFADNVRASNPFGIAVVGDLLYVADASLNLIKIVGAVSGASATLVSFPPIARPTPIPFGPPFVDAVPDNVRLYGDQLLVPLLTGFPFVPGLAEVRKVDLVGGGSQSFIKGLTSAIDAFPVKRGKNSDQFYVIEFSTNMLQNAPGRLVLLDSPTATPAVIAGPLVSPTNLARDRKTGDIFITQIFTGQVVRVDGARLFVRQHYRDFFNREPDASGWDFWTQQITQCGADAGCRDRKQVDVSRAFFYSGEFIGLHPELAAELRGTPDYNRAFVKQAYFTYLQRTCDPEVCDPAGFNFWLTKINSRLPSTDADYNEMIRAFIVSIEYRERLGLS